MNKTFNLLFIIKKSKIKANGTAPIYLRITIDGVAKEISAKRSIFPKDWDSKLQKVRGNTVEVKTLNAYLKALEQEVYNAHYNLLKDNSSVTSLSIKSKILRTEEKGRMLIPIFKDHNSKFAELVKIGEYSPGTLERYETSLKHTLDFIIWKFNSKDIDIKLIDHEFITDYEFYLRTQRNCANNTSVKYIKNFKKIIRLCIANGWIDKDPFINYKAKLIEVERDYLLQEELDTIYYKDFQVARLNLVKDIYIFSCFTGLAYIDVKQLKKENLTIGIDSNKWIFTHRQKTDTASKIPLLPIAEEIIEKYANHPQCLNEDKLLPILSNQRMNSYLKEIADICRINKELTFHTARHTFATTVTLSNGVPIESVSKMLGHTNIKTTQHYAKILDKKVSHDMEQLKEVLALKSLNNNHQSKSS
ncbi:MAG: site-specific integrase [Flavobacterium sp.]|nr:site-specific integrase [Flavobacterium sp.]